MFMPPLDSQQITGHLVQLDRIGVRLTGQPGEAAAAKYIARELAAMGARVHLEEFPVQTREVREQQLQVRYEGAWHDFPCSLLANAPGTNGEWVEAPLVFFEGPTGYRQRHLSPPMRDCIVLHLGSHLESRDHYRRLMAAAPAGLLMVDTRYPSGQPLADALFPAYTAAAGAVPTLNVAFLDAWQWRARGATHARFRVVGGMRSARSANVVAELPGREPQAGALYVGAHHDTQADSVGTDDNGTGVAGLIELCRVLAPRDRRRTIRFISFGAEEQLSVGSAAYVRRHREELAREGKVMFNLDSFGSLLGWNVLHGVGAGPLRRDVTAHFRLQREEVVWNQQVLPYADHFPFLAAGVPGFTLMRQNCSAGRFFHHRPDDTLERVSPPRMASLLGAVASFIAEMAELSELPFPSKVPTRARPAIARHWADLFGGWDGTEGGPGAVLPAPESEVPVERI